MITVLMPSNFKQDSFDCLSELCNEFPNTSLKILLFHPIGISNSISDLLLLPRRSREEQLINFNFCKQCHDTEIEMPQIKFIKWTFFYGTTLIAFKNFLEANNVETIFLPTSYNYESICKNSLNPELFINRCGLPIVSVTPRTEALHEKQSELVY